MLVLDNASVDGSAAAVRARRGEIRLIERRRRAGKAENDSALIEAARGEHCLLLNEDSELRPGAAAALVAALEADPGAGAAGAQLLDGEGRPVPCAWRFPGVGHGARRRRLPAPPADRAERRGESRRGRLGAVERPAGAARGGRARSATSTPTSSSTTTSATSAGGSPTPAGAPSSSPPPRRSTTTSSRPTCQPACPGSSNSTATGTSTCASTTPRPRRSPSAP